MSFIFAGKYVYMLTSLLARVLMLNNSFKGTLPRDFGLPFFFSHKKQAPGLMISTLVYFWNTNSNSPRYSNSKVIPRIIRVRGSKFFAMLE
jgi:hypothetical protein